MLVAEIHRKGLEEARNHEDYLTSAVFSHLRYLAPVVFWEDLFGLGVGLAGVNEAETTPAGAIAQAAAPVSRYSELRAHFWPNHPVLGEPDLAGVPPIRPRRRTGGTGRRGIGRVAELGAPRQEPRAQPTAARGGRLRRVRAAARPPL
jgi:hypothetical protein